MHTYPGLYRDALSMLMERKNSDVCLKRNDLKTKQNKTNNAFRQIGWRCLQRMRIKGLVLLVAFLPKPEFRSNVK